MPLIDSHCHLQHFLKKGELGAALARANEAGVGRFIAIGTSADDWVTYRELSAAHPGRIDYTVGLHPGHVEAGWKDAVNQLASFFIPPHTPVALGEIGLDYFHLPKDPIEAGEQMLEQEAAFRHQLDIAAQLHCPVVVHSRDSFDDTRRMIDESGVDWKRVVFHCFSYGADEVRQINERGGRASFTGIVTYKNAPGVREALLAQGVEYLMLETDCPYLSPEPLRGKSNEPAYLKHTAAYCAELLGLDLDELCGQTTANVKSFFGLE